MKSPNISRPHHRTLSTSHALITSHLHVNRRRFFITTEERVWCRLLQLLNEVSSLTQHLTLSKQIVDRFLNSSTAGARGQTGGAARTGGGTAGGLSTKLVVVAGSGEPGCGNPLPWTPNPEPSTLDPQPSTLNTKHSTLNS